MKKIVHRAADDTPTHTVVLDWDGTLVPSAWPDRPTDFMPGAIEAVYRLHEAGFKLMVFSARMNPYDPWTSTKLDPAKVEAEKRYIRATLDRGGLSFVDIWDKPGKPSGSAYVDDKGYRYTGRPGSWKAMANTLILALGGEAPLFPAFDRSGDE